jgi:membrane-bound serine protease (ClpP class)
MVPAAAVSKGAPEMKFLAVLALLLPVAGHSQSCTTSVDVTGVIGPATLDLLKRTERAAKAANCGSILLLVNTPGGALETTRLIVEQILNSEIPYLCLVSPSGGHAGSAGAIILQACHVNGGLHGTNLGAATPVAMGQDLPKDLRQKILNDTRSWLESLTGLRGRSDKFGKDIILDAKAVTAEEAQKLKAIDWVGDNEQDFLKFAGGRTVKVAGNKEAKVAAAGPVNRFEQDTRFHVLSLLTDPELAYMMLLASLALIYFEITHSGVILPGIAGAIGLVIALVALHKLEVEYGGLLLILLGVGMMIAEMFLPTFGLVGAAGIACLALGSLFLFDPVRSWGYHLPYTLIAATVLAFGLVLAGISILFIRTSRVRKKGGFEDLMGAAARVVSLRSSKQGMVELRGELWKFESLKDVQVNDEVHVCGNSGLVLKVE